MKNILPPKAVDTPEELASLSQYLLNIVDFRDRDGTITQFVNTGLSTRPRDPPGAIPAPGASFRRPVHRLTALPRFTTPHWLESDGYLVQYGMEYPPVAINETLAYSFLTKAGDSGPLLPGAGQHPDPATTATTKAPPPAPPAT